MVIIENRHMKRQEQMVRSDNILAMVFSALSMLLIVGRLFIFTPYQVSGLSMSPTLADGDRVVVTNENEYERGDIVVFESPIEEGMTYIKRIVGLEGDKVTISHGKVMVNGEEVYNDEQYGETNNYRLESINETLVPKGHFYVLGDNRENSMDSRIFGTISGKNVQGKLICRLAPVKEFYCNL